MHILN